ncbi:MAG TPA: hypothetical protein VNG33_19835 [Polyangiaceae bacterium]|nr:hypothetical protein [Polyangiaceae bacterium]
MAGSKLKHWGEPTQMPTPSTAKWPRPKSEDEWEDMVLDAMRIRWKDPNAQRNGRRGQRQDGVDIFGTAGGQAVAAQAKNMDSVSEAEVQVEVGKAERFEPSIEQFYLAVGGPRDAKLQQILRAISARRVSAGQFPVHVLFFDDICQDLAVDPVLVRKYWQSFLAAAFADALASVLADPVLDFASASSILLALPEFDALAEHLDAASNGKTRAHLRLDAAPNLAAPRGSRDRSWHLAIAESHDTHLVTLCHLAVDVDTRELAFFSVVEDRWLSRDEWLKTNLWFV